MKTPVHRGGDRGNSRDVGFDCYFDENVFRCSSIDYIVSDAHMFRSFHLRFAFFVFPVQAFTNCVFSSTPNPRVLALPRRESDSVTISSDLTSAGVRSSASVVPSLSTPFCACEDCKLSK